MDEKNLIEFGQYLKNVRKEKGLTLRKIEELSGVSNAYLSQLENGKRGIPSPDVLKKISGAIETEYEELMEKAGYINLHPETYKALEQNDLTELIANVSKIFISSISNENGELEERYKEQIVRELQANYSPDIINEEIIKSANDPLFIQRMIDSLTEKEAVIFLNEMIKEHIEIKGDLKTQHKEYYNTIPIIKVPILGHIAAGLPITAEEHIEEWTEIPNMWNMRQGEAIILKVKGDSMTGSRIYDGDKVVVKIQPEVENGEIAVVNVNGDEATLKRVRKSENGQVILYPDNPRYEPTIIANEGARIIGKVIQVMFEPK